MKKGLLRSDVRTLLAEGISKQAVVRGGKQGRRGLYTEDGRGLRRPGEQEEASVRGSKERVS